MDVVSRLSTGFLSTVVGLSCPGLRNQVYTVRGDQGRCAGMNRPELTVVSVQFVPRHGARPFQSCVKLKEPHLLAEL